MAGLRGKRAGKFFLVLWIAGLDIVIGNGLNELALVDRQLLVESATIGQPLANGAVSVLPPTTEPWGQRTCYVADPDGNLIEIGSFTE